MFNWPNRVTPGRFETDFQTTKPSIVRRVWKICSKIHDINKCVLLNGSFSPRLLTPYKCIIIQLNAFQYIIKSSTHISIPHLLASNIWKDWRNRSGETEETENWFRDQNYILIFCENMCWCDRKMNGNQYNKTTDIGIFRYENVTKWINTIVNDHDKWLENVPYAFKIWIGRRRGRKKKKKNRHV